MKRKLLEEGSGLTLARALEIAENCHVTGWKRGGFSDCKPYLSWLAFEETKTTA